MEGGIQEYFDEIVDCIKFYLGRYKFFKIDYFLYFSLIGDNVDEEYYEDILVLKIYDSCQGGWDYYMFFRDNVDKTLKYYYSVHANIGSNNNKVVHGIEKSDNFIENFEKVLIDLAQRVPEYW